MKKVKNKRYRLYVYLWIIYSFIISVHAQLIRLDGQKISTDYVLYMLKGLYIFGKNEKPFVILGKKQNMRSKESHAIFENIGISTVDTRNTKYFSFDVEEDSKEKETTKPLQEETEEKEKRESSKIKESGINENTIRGNEEGEEKNSTENKENEPKPGFKLNLYKENPYMRKKKESEYKKPYHSSTELPYLFLELIIMKEEDFNKVYLPHNNKICCEKSETEGIDGDQKYTCPGRGFIKRYNDLSNFYSIQLPVYFLSERISTDENSSELEVNLKEFQSKIHKTYIEEIEDTSIYALFLSNCIESKSYELTLHGNIHILNSYGHLPGDKIAKLNLYFMCMTIFSIYLLTWLYLLIKHRKFVIKIQIWILICICVYVMDNLFLFLYFLEYNLHANINNELLFLSVCSGILKNVCSYLLILLGSLGWGLVIPTLNAKTSMKIKFLFFFFIFFDFIKHFLDLYFSDSSVSTFFICLYLFPLTVIYTIIYLWVFSSTSRIILQLNEDRQYEKLNIYKKFFNVLVFTLIFSVISLGIDLLITLSLVDISWSVKSYLNDGISSSLFIIILTAMMILFKPCERLKRIAHFTEIGDMDEMEDFSNFKNVVEDVP